MAGECQENGVSLHMYGLSYLSERIAAREITARALVESCIERTRRVNPGLNALVAERFEHALREADALDAEMEAGGARGPLHGIPFVVSESLAVAGSPHSAGLVSRSAIVAEFDATVVARLRAAGAIVLGVSNVAEFGFWVETHSRVYGRANNPFDVRATTGGSNGGGAALVAAGCVPFAIGVDTIGSSRIPAALCGVFAYKASGCEVPITGLYPEPVGRARRFAAIAVTTRNATDLGLVLNHAQGPDGHDRGVVSEATSKRIHPRVDFMYKRVIVTDGLGVPGTHARSDVRKAVARAAEALHAEGGEIERWRPDAFERSAGIWLGMQHEAYGLHHTFREAIAEGQRVSLLLESTRMLFGRSRYTFPSLAMVLTERLTKGSYAAIQRNCAEGRRLRERLNLMLADSGVLVLPSWPRTAPRHKQTLKHPGAFLYTALPNILSLPSVVVPLGLARDGLPLSVQLVAAEGRDDVCLAAAAVIERRLGGYVPPPL